MVQVTSPEVVQVAAGLLNVRGHRVSLCEIRPEKLARKEMHTNTTGLALRTRRL